jgi:DNA polymerase (family X)
MDNATIADCFDEMAELLELRGENQFRVRAYRNGAKAIRELAEQVADILADKDRNLRSFTGIGDTLADKCQVMVDTGRLPQLDDLRANTPAVLVKMTRIPGVGAKKAMALQKELKVQTLEELRQACIDGKVRDLKGFGAKTEQAILAGLDIAESAALRLRIDQADHLVVRLRQHMQACSAITNMEFAGSYRRGKETVGDIDILVVSDDHDAVMDRFAQFPALASIIARGETKMSIRVDDQFQVDLRVVPAESFGAALQYFTGSKDHNVAVRGRARKMGYTVNEYGVAKLDTPDKILCGATEEELYKILDLKWIAPELREGRQELAWAEKDDFPPLIAMNDIIGDLHMHTTDSDGSNSLEEMVEAAEVRGRKYIAITDHSKRVSMARGLDSDRLLAQWDRIDRFNAEHANGVKVLKGVECDILEAGPLDIPDEVLAKADWVIASVHYGQKQPKEQITDRIVGALRNPNVDAIAHPTGRLLGSRPAYEVDMQAVFQAAVEHRKILELNANPHRLDLSEVHLMAASAQGIPIAIDTDAHSIEGMDVMRFGITQARRAGLLKSQVVNSWSLSKLMEWINNR